MAKCKCGSDLVPQGGELCTVCAALRDKEKRKAKAKRKSKEAISSGLKKVKASPIVRGMVHRIVGGVTHVLDQFEEKNKSGEWTAAHPEQIADPEIIRKAILGGIIHELSLMLYPDKVGTTKVEMPLEVEGKPTPTGCMYDINFKKVV